MHFRKLLPAFILVWLPGLLAAHSQRELVSQDTLQLYAYLDSIYEEASPSKVIYYASEALTLAQKVRDEDKVVSALIGMGYGFRLKGELEKSLQHLVQAADLSRKNGDFNLDVIYMEMSNTHLKSGDTGMALLYNQRAVAILRQGNDEYNLAATLLNTGSNFKAMGRYDSAIAYYQEAKEIFESMDFSLGTGHCLGNIASANLKLGEVTKAVAGFWEAIAILEAENDDYGVSDFSIELGIALVAEGQIEQARTHLHKGYLLAKALDLKEQVKNASKALADLHASRGDKAKAYDFQSTYLAMRDSIANEEVIQKLANQRADFEISLKQAEVDISEAKRKNQQIALISTGIILFLILVMFVLGYRQYQIKLDLTKELKALNQSKDKLFSIVSHDLRGPLASFKSVAHMIRIAVSQKQVDALMEIADEVYKTSNQLSSLLENLLTWAVREKTNFDVVAERISVEQLMQDMEETFAGMAKAKQIELIIQKKAVAILADRNMTYTIFRNLVNNALKFTPENGKIWLWCEQAEEYLIFHVKDTGVGIQAEKLDGLFKFQSEKTSFGTKGEKGLGLGLSLVYEFIQQNDGSISVESKPQEGTLFTVKLKAA